MNPDSEISPYFIEQVKGRRMGGALGGPLPYDHQMPEATLGLRDYWLIFRKHLHLVIAVVAASVALTAITVLVMRPLYTSQATLLIERNAPQVLDFRQAMPEPMMSEEYDYYKTQYELLKSRTLAADVIRGRGLENELAGEIGTKTATPTAIDPDGINDRLVDAYLKHLEIKPRAGTRLVSVAYTAPDPKLAAEVANEHALAYIRHGMEMRSNANEEAQHFLENKLVELRERVESSEAALNAYRRDKGILSINGKENLALERLDELSRRVNEAEAERIGLEAQEQMIRSRNYESLPAVISSELIEKLKQDSAEIEEQYAGMAAQFKKGYPPLDELWSRAAKSRARLDQEIRKVVEGIESSYLAAVEREKELRDTMAEQKTVVLAQNDAAVKYAILAREVDTNRQLYDSVLQRMKEMGVAADIRASNIFVVDRAEPSRYPSRPAKVKDVSISALLGLAGAVGIVLVLETLENTFKTPDEIQRVLRLPSLALVPKFAGISSYHKPLLDSDKNNGASRHHGDLIVARERFSPITEAYRTLRTNLLLSRAEEPPKVTLITSALSSEGKTVTSVNTAALFASMGMKVLLVDADLRRPRCHELLLSKNVNGLTELLTGQIDLDDVIQTTPVDNLHLISAGAIAPNPAELIGSKMMRQTIETLRDRFDFVFIDSAPVMIVSDSLFVAALADGTIVVVDSSATPRSLVTEMCARLERIGAKILGVVLNNADVQHSGYYYHTYKPSSYHRAPARNGQANGFDHAASAD
jgi:capsular exopolysaccharide synthesis family protein